MFLVDAPKPALFEAGACFTGKMYVEDINSTLPGRPPSFLFLTHAHWDHCGAVAHLKEAFPTLQVAASSMAADILRRPNALALIRKLNDDARTYMDSFPGIDTSLFIDETFQPFEVDIELEDSSVIDLGNGTTVEILATPGHTRDHHSFYLPREKVMIAGEAAGLLLNTGEVTTEFLFDYDAYLLSLQKLAQLPIEVFCQGHNLVIIGEEKIKTFLERSIQETIDFKDRALELLDEEDGSVEQVIQRVKAERYDPIQGLKQPVVPYMINLTAKINHLAARKNQPSGAVT